MAKKSRSKTVVGKKAKRAKAAPGRASSKRAAATLSAPWKASAEPPPPPPRIKKTTLSTTELKEFRQMLLVKRKALMGDMSGMAAEALGTNRQEGTGDLSKIPTHDADVGTDNFEQEFTLGLLESERVLLNEIDEALDRIKKRTYGICPGTGKPISKARLRARPWAKYCIEYARMVEKGLAGQGAERKGAGQQQYAENTDEEDSEAEATPEADEAAED